MFCESLAVHHFETVPKNTHCPLDRVLGQVQVQGVGTSWRTEVCRFSKNSIQHPGRGAHSVTVAAAVVSYHHAAVLLLLLLFERLLNLGSL